MLYDGIGNFYIDNLIKKPKDDIEIFSHIDAYPFFEIIRVIKRIPLFLDEHINRLLEGLKFSYYYEPPAIEKLKIALYAAIRENDIDIGNIKLAVVEDDYETEHVFAFPVKSSYPSEEDYKNGCSVILHPVDRTVRNILYSSLSNGDIWKRIIKEGAAEALLMSSDLRIREGSSSNLFFVKENKIITAPENEVISTANRDFIFKILKELEYKIEINSLSVKDLYSVDGAFITGSLIGIMPISKIEGIALKSTKNLNIKKIGELYEEKIAEYIKKNSPGEYD